MPSIIQTLNGPVPADSLGLILPHEHLFVDLRGPLAPNYGEADPEVVARLMQPYLDAAQARGVTAFVDCAPPGVGRNVTVLRRLAQTTPIHLIAPTGTYREGFMPLDWLDLSAEALADIWVGELTDGMDGTDSRAGFIKIAMSDDGPRPLEVRSLKAAALASKQTGAVVASHTIGGAVARREMDILEAEGHDLRRFIWVHAHTEPDTAVHVEAAHRGVWVEFDAIGAEKWQPQDALLESVLALLDAGYAANMLLSHDAGWYEVGQPDGQPRPDGVRGFTALFDDFIPAMKARGVDDETLRLLTVTNPARAYTFYGAE